MPDCIASESAFKSLMLGMPHHPDSHELYDWPQYGPRNTAIADLVWQLAYDRGMRVVDIELVIERALRDELARGRAMRIHLAQHQAQITLERISPIEIRILSVAATCRVAA